MVTFISSCRRAFAVILTVTLMCLFVLLQPVDAAELQTEMGWIEIRAAVPEDFDGSVIVSVENQETLDVFDFEVLAINDYVSSQRIPSGSYIVSMAFVYEDYTHSVQLAEKEFTVVPDGVAACLNATVSKQEISAEDPDTSDVPNSAAELNEPAPTSSLSAETVVLEALDADTSELAEESIVENEEAVDSELSISNLVISFLGSVVFFVVVCGVVYYIRERYHY